MTNVNISLTPEEVRVVLSALSYEYDAMVDRSEAMGSPPNGWLEKATLNGEVARKLKAKLAIRSSNGRQNVVPGHKMELTKEIAGKKMVWLASCECGWQSATGTRQRCRDDYAVHLHGIHKALNEKVA